MIYAEGLGLNPEIREKVFKTKRREMCARLLKDSP